MADVALHIYEELRALWPHRHGAAGGTGQVANFAEIEQRVVGMIHDVLGEAAANEKTVDVVVGEGLAAVGAPPEIAQAAQGLIGMLLSHFTAESQAKAEAAAAAAQAEPAPAA